LIEKGSIYADYPAFSNSSGGALLTYESGWQLVGVHTSNIFLCADEFGKASVQFSSVMQPTREQKDESDSEEDKDSDERSPKKLRTDVTDVPRKGSAESALKPLRKDSSESDADEVLKFHVADAWEKGYLSCSASCSSLFAKGIPGASKILRSSVVLLSRPYCVEDILYDD